SQLLDLLLGKLRPWLIRVRHELRQGERAEVPQPPTPHISGIGDRAELRAGVMLPEPHRLLDLMLNFLQDVSRTCHSPLPYAPFPFSLHSSRQHLSSECPHRPRRW